MGTILLINFFVMLILFLSGLFTQSTSKKSVFYGVRVPIGYEKNEKLIKLHKMYQKNLIISFLFFAIISTVVIVSIPEEISTTLILPEALLGLAVIGINYLIVYTKVKQLRKSGDWSIENKDVVIVDTRFREKDDKNKKTVISTWWFIIPLSLMIITLISILIKSQSGHIDQSLIFALSSTMIQAFINLIFFMVYKWTEKAKQSLNGGRLGEIKYRSRKIRYYTSVGYLLLAICMNLIIMVVGFSICEIINPSLISGIGFVIISILLPIVIILIVVLVAHNDIKNNEYCSKTKLDQQLINRDDDQYYKFGSIYFNKNDPALFVEKRTGIGTTMNFARPAAKVSMGILIAIIVIPLILMFVFMPGMTKERQIDINQNSITISGTWGTEISKEQVSKVAIENNLPTVIMKTNGADIGNKLFGKHKLEGYNNSVLFIEDKTKPFVAIYLKDGKFISINYADESKTKNLFNDIMRFIGH